MRININKHVPDNSGHDGKCISGSYSSKHGLFSNRLHVLNHIDMILGLNKAEESEEYIERFIVLIDHKNETIALNKRSKLSDKDIITLRTIIVKQSIYAIEWQQVMIKKDIKSIEEDIDKTLGDAIKLSLEVWEERDGGSKVFYNSTSVVVAIAWCDGILIDRIVVNKIPTESELNNTPIPINDRRVLSAIYASDMSWMVFSKRICNNEFIRMQLVERQNNRCAVCHKQLDEHIVVHHIDYNHRCLLYASGLEWRVPKTRVQPNCELCFNTNNAWFTECMQRLRAVHKSCNYTINSAKDNSITLIKNQNYKIGDRVKHSFLGYGVVTDVAGIRKQQKVTILFENGKKRCFASACAPITIIDQDEV